MDFYNLLKMLINYPNTLFKQTVKREVKLILAKSSTTFRT